MWYPVKSMVVIYDQRMSQTHQEINDMDNNNNNRTTTSIDKINKNKKSYICCCCFISQKFIKRIALFDAKMIGVNDRMSGKDNMKLQYVASSSNNPNQLGLGQQIAMTSMGDSMSNNSIQIQQQQHGKTKQLKTSNGDIDNYKFNDIDNVDDDEDTENGLENHDISIDGNDDDIDDYEDFNYDDGPREIVEEEDEEQAGNKANKKSKDQLTPIGVGSDITIDIGEADNIKYTESNTATNNDTLTPLPDAIIPIKPGKKSTIDIVQEIASKENEKIMNDGIISSKLFESNEGIKLFINHCAKEFSIENILALIEFNQFQNYCKKQEKFIEKQIELRKKTAKQRTAKKKQSIQRLKKHKNEELRNKKLQLTNRDSYKNRERQQQIIENGQNIIGINRPSFQNNLSGGRQQQQRRRMQQNNHSNNRKKSHTQRRRERIKQNNIDQNIMDDDDLILHEIANKPPIDTPISNTLQYMEDNGSNGSDDDKYNKYSSDKKSNDDDLENYEMDDGNQGDDEDDDIGNNLFNRMYGSFDLYSINYGYLLDSEKLNLPESTIVNRPFIINSKNKRTQQLELIIIDLCKKYILPKSEFQLNLPKYIISDINIKINAMKENHQFRKQKQLNRQRQQQLQQQQRHNNGNNNNNDSDDDSFIGAPGPRLQLTMTESNASNWYPEHHEHTLPMFFDDIIEALLRLINDSFYRLKLTQNYKNFINHNNNNI